MRCIIKWKGEYATGRGRYRRGWSPKIESARVFNRIVDAKNSDAYFKSGKEAEIIAVKLTEVGPI